VDEAAQGVRRHQPQDPKYEQYDDDSFQHLALQVDVPGYALYVQLEHFSVR
jgi:hypothetical protein